jgi:hypothetical protein
MLRKMLVLGALAVVAVVLGAANASAHPNPGSSPTNHASFPGQGQGTDGFSDGRTVG